MPARSAARSRYLRNCMVRLGSTSVPLLQCGQGQLVAGEVLIRLVAVHQHRHLVVALGIEVEGLSGGTGERLVKPQPDIALVQLQL